MVVKIGWANVPIAADLNFQGMDSVVTGVRPEDIAIDGDGSGTGTGTGTGSDHVTFKARVEVIEHLGAEVILEVAADQQLLTISRVNPYLQLKIGDILNCSFPVDKAFFFNAETEEAIYA